MVGLHQPLEQNYRTYEHISKILCNTACPLEGRDHLCMHVWFTVRETPIDLSTRAVARISSLITKSWVREPPIRPSISEFALSICRELDVGDVQQSTVCVHATTPYQERFCISWPWAYPSFETRA